MTTERKTKIINFLKNTRWAGKIAWEALLLSLSDFKFEPESSLAGWACASCSLNALFVFFFLYKIWTKLLEAAVGIKQDSAY